MSAGGRVTDGRRAERGAGGVDLAIAATGLLLALFFVVGALRISTVRSDVSAAARAAARAAAHSYELGAARGEATSVAEEALADRDVVCRNLRVDIGGDVAPGALVTATVRCTVDLDDVTLVGFGRREVVEATAVEMVDVLRGSG